ncbi:MAG: hypothetical protein JW914_07745 [Syntrophaceae bacterium]|nr:hypothetical protein [Syntrophaceae bacterium]
MEAAEPRHIENKVIDGKTYEMYEHDDVEQTKAWLATRTVTQPLYYITVRTLQGTWGVDKDGIWLANLLSWQINLALAKFSGSIHGTPSMAGVRYAAMKISDNFVATVSCGDPSCGSIWQDGLRYGGETVVRCPKCKAFSRIDTANIIVI